MNKVRYEGGLVPFDGWVFLEILGEDRESFLQNQTTNDLKKCDANFGQLNTRLDRNGKIQTFFYIGKKKDKLLLIVPDKIAKFTIEEFEKFIIMEDVKVKQFDCGRPHFYLTPNRNQILQNTKLEKENLLSIDFLGEEGILYWGEINNSFFKEVKEIPKDMVDGLRVLNGWPFWGQNVDRNKLINETILNELAISYSKGCFLGQETVSKINNNRGATYYPVLFEVKNYVEKEKLGILKNQDFKIKDRKGGTFLSFYLKDNSTFMSITLYREFRVKESSITLHFENGLNFKGIVHYLPYFKDKSPREKADELYYKGVKLFQEEKEKESIELLELCLEIFPGHSDAYESIGVILGRLGQFEKAIDYMDRLLAVEPESVMAHTNKSLYLMKLGRIEEAEEEKGHAAVKSFSYFGKEAERKKEHEEKEKFILDDLKRKEGMFLQVLELDRNDILANFGLGEVSYKKNNYIKAVDFLEKVLVLNPKYSMAYLVLGKSYEALGDFNKAKEIYSSGIEVASKKGDMMPANEMQSHLSRLADPTRFKR
jgi:folate-binding protein YgfZ